MPDLNNIEESRDTILKRCPFCGGKAIELSPYEQKPMGSRWIIECVECGANIRGSHRYMNRNAWNRRAE